MVRWPSNVISLLVFSLVCHLATAQAPPKAGADDKAPEKEKTEPQVKLEDFLKALSKDDADKYKGHLVVGSGPNFNGSTLMNIKDGKGDVFYILTPFYVGPNDKLIPIRTGEQWVKVQVQNHPMLRVVVEGNKLPRKPNEPLGQVYYFAGVFEGKYETHANAVALAGQKARSDKAAVLVRSKVSYTGPIQLNADQAKKPNADKPAAEDAEGQAAEILKRAQEVAESSPALARLRCNDLLKRFPNSKAAADARQLLKQLDKKKK